MTKALLIRSYERKSTGEQGKWNKLDQTASYIQGIETGKILDNLTADNLALLISGVPTPWARAKLFRFAFHTLANPDANIQGQGLLQYYKILCGEWRGLLALMALHPDRISISRPVEMNTKGENYDIASAFGRMLFNEADLWCDQENYNQHGGDLKPYVQLIYYRGHLVGATSPLTGVFTGVYYDLSNDASDISWYRGGKFEDPTPYLDPAQVQKLYLFVKNMSERLEAFEKMVNSARGRKPVVDLGGFKKMVRSWQDDLYKKGNERLRPIGPVANYGPQLARPFSLLFTSSVPVYLKRDDYTFTYTVDPAQQYDKIDDIQSLLAADTNVLGWSEAADTRNSLKDASVFYLRVQEPGASNAFYFTLPLSEQAVEIFRNQLSSILGYKPTQGASLRGTLTPDGNLAVTMTLSIDGEAVPLGVREYKVLWQTKPQKVILWPNFISDRWNRYYLYQQKTEGGQPNFLPIYQERRELIKTPDGHFFTEDYKPDDGSRLPVTITQLVAAPPSAGDTLPKYSIYQYDKPLAGLIAKVKQGGRELSAGYLIVRQPDKVKDLSENVAQPKAVVGIDFGSNNTCVYYDIDNEPKPVEFHNYRLMLVGQELASPNRVAEIDELLFFTNYDTNDGQFKSWVHEHDIRCNHNNQSDEIAGGVPVNRPNVQVNKMTDRVIETQAGTLHYNMKWLDDDQGKLMKRAFIKSLWLQTCAFLYQKQLAPKEIRWSYPGSMIKRDRNFLATNIFEKLPAMTPIVNTRVTVGSSVTEAEAVCSYAVKQDDCGLTSSTVELGIDVGGSSSDILLLAKLPLEGEKLITESSVRLAAGVFFGAVTESQRFRDALVTFHAGRKTGVYVMNIDELQDPANKSKAPYYLNCIFDQLKPEEYATFYSSLNDNASFVFAIPAYVTGVLLFYAGMLIGKAAKDGSLSSEVNQVDVLPFGKGGRLFHWLYSSAGEDATNDYYEKCLNTGAACVSDRKFRVSLRNELAARNKTEVAYGLCSLDNELKYDPQVGDTDICGEQGVRYIRPDGSAEKLAVDQSLDGSYFQDLNSFDFSEGPCFSSFIDLFARFVCRDTTIYNGDEEELMKDLRDVPGRIANFMRKDSEYTKALKGSARDEVFPYHQPIFIAEAASYLRTLVDKIFARQ